MASLLFELGTEELPPRAIPQALQQLSSLAEAAFREARLEVRGVRVFGTPRRLVLYSQDVAPRQREAVRMVRGPAAKVAYDEQGNPTKAALGFARSQGVAVEALVRQRTEEGEYVFAIIQEPTRPAPEVLAEIFPRLFGELAFPKTMRWGDGDARFARPVRWIVALYDEEVIPTAFAGIESGRLTRGHRFASPGPHPVRDPEDYLRVLREAFVLLDQEEREAAIREQLARAAQEVGGRPRIDPALLQEAVYTAEWPTVLLGRFPEEFLDLPQEVLVTVMQHHQKYFPVEGPDGMLLPFFLAVRDGPETGLDAVREGHEWVLRARLADARFFFREDRKVRLEERVERLKGVLFLEGLGTLYDKAKRLEEVTAWICRVIGVEAQRETVRRAALLSKADLVTSMVGELPELQGVMGRIYALLDGEPVAVAEALEDHYRPRSAEDSPPRTLAGAILAIADRMDTLVGAISRGLTPTGSQDPYGLRRAAQGVFAALFAHKLHLSLHELICAVQEAYGMEGEESERTREEAQEFLRARLRATLLEEGIPYDVVDATLAVEVDDPVEAHDRAVALAQVREWPEFPRLFVAYDRASRILPKEFALELKEDLLTLPAEKVLYETWRQVDSEVEALIRMRRYHDAWRALLRLADPVDRLFESVLIMDPDESVRRARLSLLSRVVQTFRRLADLSRIVLTL